MQTYTPSISFRNKLLHILYWKWKLFENIRYLLYLYPGNSYDSKIRTYSKPEIDFAFKKLGSTVVYLALSITEFL